MTQAGQLLKDMMWRQAEVERARQTYISKIYNIVTRAIDWAAQYPISADTYNDPIVSANVKALLGRMGTIDLVSPAVSIVTSAILGKNNTRTIKSEILPEEIVTDLQNIISGYEWDFAIRKAVRDCVMYGTGFIHFAFSEETGIKTTPLPFYSEIVVDPFNPDTVMECHTGWVDSVIGEIERTITPTEDVFHRKRQSPQNVSVANPFDFTPVVYIKNIASMSEGSPYGLPMFMGLADASMFVSGACNDAIYLMRALSHSIVYIIGAEKSDISISYGPTKIINAPDPNTQIGVLNPQTKVSEIADFVSQHIKRAAGLSGIPPDLIEPRSLSNTGSGAVQTLFEPLKAIAALLRGEIGRKERQAITMISRMLAIMKKIKMRIDDITENSFEFKASYQDSDAGVNQSEVQALQMALEAGLISFNRARKILNPDESQEEIDAARAEWQAEKNAKLAVFGNIQ